MDERKVFPGPLWAQKMMLLKSENERLRAALRPFAAVQVESMLSLEEASLDKEDFYRARAALNEQRTVPND